MDIPELREDFSKWQTALKESLRQRCFKTEATSVREIDVKVRHKHKPSTFGSEPQLEWFEKLLLLLLAFEPKG
jgi:hypothetical protein